MEDAMSFKQFNIYNRVHAPDYANTGAKSFGTNSTTHTEVVVGTSSRNSHDFLIHETKVLTKPDGNKLFQFWLDGNLIKEAVYDVKEKTITAKASLISTALRDNDSVLFPELKPDGAKHA